MVELLIGFFVLLATMSLVRHVRRRQRLRHEPRPRAPERCRCGYPLEALDTIRCPECGRVRGFDQTAEELGLTDEQLKAAKQKLESRRGMRS